MSLNPTFVNWICNMIFAESALIAFLSLTILSSMVIRRRRTRLLDELRSTFSLALVENLIQEGNIGSRLPKAETSLAREALRMSLLENINSITGAERVRLEVLYEELGFIKMDQEFAKSMFRKRRLYAVSNLAALKSQAAVPILKGMVSDGEPLVRAAALLALSAIPGAISDKFEVAKVADAFQHRRGALCHLLSNLAQSRGLESLLPLLKPEIPTHLQDACIQVLLTTRSPEAIPHLCRVLETRALQPALLLDILLCLKNLGDPDCTPSVRNLLSSSDERVRARALDLFAELSGSASEVGRLLGRYAKDPSGHVRAIAQRHLDRREAA